LLLTSRGTMITRLRLLVSIFFVIGFFCTKLSKSAVLNVTEEQSDISCANEEFFDDIKKYQEDNFIESLLNNVEEVSQKYCSDSFIDKIINAEKIQREVMCQWGNQLLLELPIKKIVSQVDYSIGIYVKDLLKAGFVGIEWGIDWLFYQNFIDIQVDVVTNRLIQSSDVIINLSNELLPPSLQKENKQKNLSEQQIKALDVLYEHAQKQIMSSYSDLFLGSKGKIILSSFIAIQLAIAIKNHYLVNESEKSFSLLNLLNSKDQPKQEQPIPIFSIIKEQWPMGIAVNSCKTSTIRFITDFFESCGFMPQWSSNKCFELTRDFSLYLFFIIWLNKYFFALMWKNYLFSNLQELLLLLKINKTNQKDRLYPGTYCANTTPCNRYQGCCSSDCFSDCTKEKIKDFVRKGITMPFSLWISLKNQKLTEWSAIYHALISIPGWYKMTKFAYGVYQEIAKEASV
jgi:hypothetical protein